MSVLVGHGDNNAASRFRLIFTLLLVLTLASTVSCNKREPTTENIEQKTFASPEAAGTALYDAAKTGDQNTLMSIFGPAGKDLIFSGDPIKDKNAAERFVAEYDQMNRWSRSASGQWTFNTTAGKNEVLARRIGDGELTTIGVLTQIADAQQEYFNQNHQFAQKFLSDEGQHNGLYWPVPEGQPPSPLGPLADVAKSLGYTRSDKPQPFNGYYYRILTQQGDAAKGGTKNYLADGKLTGGFAILAWPAKYQDSGIMTFITGADGVVREKDLGEKTAEEATAIMAYDPGEGWTIVLSPETAEASTGAESNKK